MNLNFTHKNDYNLNKKLIDEMIKMYGIECKLLLVEKNHVDPEVFGDWDSINTNCEVKYIHLLAENSDDIDHQYPFGDFGFNTFETSTVFLSAYEFEYNNLSIKQLLSSLIVFPSNKVLEITDVQHQVPGVNNLWSYSDEKSAYKLTLRTYEFRLHDETDGNLMCSTVLGNEFSKEFTDIIENENDTSECNECNDTSDCNCDEFADWNDWNDNEEINAESAYNSITDKIKSEKENYDVLDGYFDRLLKIKDDIEHEAEITEYTIAKDTTKENNIDKKPIVINNEKDPFGW